jgi:hypothetical protein
MLEVERVLLSRMNDILGLFSDTALQRELWVKGNPPGVCSSFREEWTMLFDDMEPAQLIADIAGELGIPARVAEAVAHDLDSIEAYDEPDGVWPTACERMAADPAWADCVAAAGRILGALRPYLANVRLDIQPGGSTSPNVSDIGLR